jgi:hypothetical protein
MPFSAAFISTNADPYWATYIPALVETFASTLYTTVNMSYNPTYSSTK